MMHLPSSSMMEWLRIQIVLSFSCQPHSLLFLSWEFKADFTYPVFNMGDDTYWQDCHPFFFLSLFHALPPLYSHHCVLPGLLEQSLIDLPTFWYSGWSVLEKEHPQPLWNITTCLWQLFPNNYPSQELGYHPTSVSFSPACWSGATSCLFFLLGVSHTCLTAPSLCCSIQDL